MGRTNAPGLDPLRPGVWIVDPIGYTGMDYYDVSLADGLRRCDVDAIVVGSDRPLLVGATPTTVARRAVFRGTSRGRRIRRAVAYGISLGRLVVGVARERPAVIHWQYLEVPVLDVMAMQLLRLFRVRQVYTAHELLPWAAGVLDQAVMGHLYRTVQRVIVHNERDRKDLAVRFAVDPARVWVIPHGDYSLHADPALPQSIARSDLGLPANRPTALFFGALRPAKGLDVLLDAWPRVQSSVPGALLVIAGKPYRRAGTDHIRRRIDELGIADSTVLKAGVISPDDANRYYRASDLVVLPYRAITTSGVLRYAYSSARPVVATSVGEHVDWVVPGVTGSLVPPGDAFALGSEIAAMLADPETCQRLGSEAHAYGLRHFDWRTIAQRTRSTYLSMFTDPMTAAP